MGLNYCMGIIFNTGNQNMEFIGAHVYDLSKYFLKKFLFSYRRMDNGSLKHITHFVKNVKMFTDEDERQ